MAVKDTHVILLVSQWCATCPNADALWQNSFKYEVLDVAQPEGRMWAKKPLIEARRAIES